MPTKPAAVPRKPSLDPFVVAALANYEPSLSAKREHGRYTWSHPEYSADIERHLKFFKAHCKRQGQYPAIADFAFRGWLRFQAELADQYLDLHPEPEEVDEPQRESPVADLLRDPELTQEELETLRARIASRTAYRERRAAELEAYRQRVANEPPEARVARQEQERQLREWTEETFYAHRD